MLPEFVEKVLHKIANESYFIDYKLEYNAGSKAGDNFLGVLVAVAVKGTRHHNGTIITDALHLMVKIPPADPVQRQQSNSHSIFDRELYIYTTVLPTLTAFQRAKGVPDADIFSSFPKVYACDYDADHDTHILVMENLRARNFDMWPKETAVPLDHELLVMEALGRLHGLSFAFKDQRPREFEQFTQLDDILSKLMNSIPAVFFNGTSDKVVAALTNPAFKQLVTPERLARALNKSVGPEAHDRFGVITHGDCWINNYMFHYPNMQQDREHVNGIAIVDWQISRYASPALDLLHHIFSVTDKKFRDEHFGTLLR